MQLPKVRTKDSLVTADPLHHLRSMRSFPAEVAFQGFGGSLPRLKEGAYSTPSGGKGRECQTVSKVMCHGMGLGARKMLNFDSYSILLCGGMLKKLVFLMAACATRQGESQMMQGTDDVDKEVSRFMQTREI